MKEIIYKLIGSMFLLVGGFFLTFWVEINVPFDGPEILRSINGAPAGLPFSFGGSGKYLSPGSFPIGLPSFDPLALVLDIIFWATSLYFIWYLIKRFLLLGQKILIPNHQLLEKITNFSAKFFPFVFLGTFVSFQLAHLPTYGFQVLGISCGDPAGLPFAFWGFWKYWRGVQFLYTACPVNIDIIALILDVVFWALILYFIWYLYKKFIFNKFQNV